MLYALQLPDGRLVAAYVSQGEEFDHYQLSGADGDEVPHLVESPEQLRHWQADAADRSRVDVGSYDASYDRQFRAQLARAEVVQVEIQVIGVVLR